ncbi:MAG: hypothetical protein HOL77_05485, partial [Rhodobacteraceae bacterium]|nr:hypothetical protein [Paracoccaceae bacterium]
MIDLQLFLNAAPIVQTHIGTAVFAVGIGPLAVFRRRRDGWHKLLGYFWVLALATLVVMSFFITGLRPGQFSAIHLLSILVLVDWSGQKSPIWDSHCTQNMRFRRMRTGISFTVSLADRLRLQAIVA